MFKNIMMLGGGKKIKSALRGEESLTIPSITVLVLLFIVQVMVVQWSYNKVAPKLISHWNTDPPPFQPLTFQEALLFVLLIFFLF